MVFWRKKKGEVEAGAVTSILGQELQLEGDVSFKGKLRLDGRVKGNVRGDYLILGENGVVIGDVLVNTFVCSGRVDGNVNAKKFQISNRGVINGKVEASDLAVESGAALNGEVKSRSKELRLVPGTSIPKEEWDAQVKGAATGAAAAKKAATGDGADDKPVKQEAVAAAASAGG
ncbi:bactofilin family protein [Desulfurivibrio dismutans]|uniref:bactofilin family protein n=1 Tax=Desulfurivibrio dismutans TaxID=1398908 RepID=UPI0023DA1152|nr:polymer-forming cytoskeletal protein [Desulfurivibrio alkaliphilus]MDF1614129.1 polymer-forming cytoskeletal protein [Desulfurivibrio alkaliphilus]